MKSQANSPDAQKGDAAQPEDPIDNSTRSQPKIPLSEEEYQAQLASLQN